MQYYYDACFKKTALWEKERFIKAFNEGDHPRGEGGRFINKDFFYTKEEEAEAVRAFSGLSNVLETGKASSVYNEQLGEIIIDAGEIGKSGYGLKHIIEQRYVKDGKGIDEITALLPLVIDAARNGKVTRENSRFIEISKDGIIAIIRKEHDERNEKWVLTGFDDWGKQQEAQDAIRTVIARYSYTPEYSSFRKQVGAFIASVDKVLQENERRSSLEKSLFLIRWYLLKWELEKTFLDKG